MTIDTVADTLAPVALTLDSGEVLTFGLCPEHKEWAKTSIYNAIDGAQRAIRVGIYGYDDPVMHGKLKAAKLRRVYILLVLDSVQAAGLGEHGLVVDAVRSGFEVYQGTSPEHKIRHSKFLVVDGLWVELGSLNYSLQAYEQNNSVITAKSVELAAFYTADLHDNVDWLKTNEPAQQAQLKSFLEVPNAT